MAEGPSTQQPPRARPVGDLPAEALALSPQDLARRWAVALVLGRPFEQLGALQLGALADDAPLLCAQALRALQSDTELQRLTGRGDGGARAESAPARRLAAVAGVDGAAGLVAAVEALRGALWEALLDRLPDPSTRLLGDVADRLAFVCAECSIAALEAGWAWMAEDSAAGRPPFTGAERDDGTPVAGRARRPPVAATSGDGAVIVDEGVTRAPAAERDGARSERPRGGAGAEGRPLSWDESPPVTPPRRASAPPAEPGRHPPDGHAAHHARAMTLALGGDPGEIEIRDERGVEGPAAWIGAIGSRLARFAEDGQPFAVLLVEMLELERLRRSASPQDFARLAQRMEDVLAVETRERSGMIARERPGRAWLIAGGLDADGARALAERLTRAVAATLSFAGAPVRVAIGTAVCPPDGREAAALAAHADVGLYAARAAAR